MIALPRDSITEHKDYEFIIIIKTGMIEFKKLTPDELPALSEYFSKQTTRISVYSAAYQFMWNRELHAPFYAVVEN